jgi:hypothetical protein
MLDFSVPAILDRTFSGHEDTAHRVTNHLAAVNGLHRTALPSHLRRLRPSQPARHGPEDIPNHKQQGNELQESQHG